MCRLSSREELEILGLRVGRQSSQLALAKREMPLVFQNRSPQELCEQLKDPQHNGNMTIQQLFDHIAYDPLVLWDGNPEEQEQRPHCPTWDLKAVYNLDGRKCSMSFFKNAK